MERRPEDMEKRKCRSNQVKIKKLLINLASYDSVKVIWSIV